MSFSPLVDQFIAALQCLPGVGPKSAQRMVFHLLERNREAGNFLAQTMQQALHAVKRCESCRTLSETPLCQLCLNPKRDKSLLCVVESPTDIVAIEQIGGFRGLYFVLMGHLSPLDGIGPTDIGLDILAKRLQENVIQELILATGTTVEGEATAHTIATLARDHQVKVSRIAHGVPLGDELSFVDSQTLAHAFAGRKVVHFK